MIFTVRVLRRAWSDADTIFEWIATRSPGGASRWYAAFLSAAYSLAVDPLRCSVAPERDAVGQEVRQIFFRTPRGRLYRLLFIVKAEEVHVLRVRAPGQAPITGEELGS